MLCPCRWQAPGRGARLGVAAPGTPAASAKTCSLRPPGQRRPYGIGRAAQGLAHHPLEHRVEAGRSWALAVSIPPCLRGRAPGSQTALPRCEDRAARQLWIRVLLSCDLLPTLSTRQTSDLF